MTVDSIGNSDCEDDEGIEGGSGKSEAVNVGEEHVKKVDAYWCDLCHCYLSHNEEYETALKRHCSLRTHLKSYVRHRDNKNLRKTAELIHKRHKVSKEEDDKEKGKIKCCFFIKFNPKI